MLAGLLGVLGRLPPKAVRLALDLNEWGKREREEGVSAEFFCRSLGAGGWLGPTLCKRSPPSLASHSRAVRLTRPRPRSTHLLHVDLKGWREWGKGAAVEVVG